MSSNKLNSLSASEIPQALNFFIWKSRKAETVLPPSDLLRNVCCLPYVRIDYLRPVCFKQIFLAFIFCFFVFRKRAMIPRSKLYTAYILLIYSICMSMSILPAWNGLSREILRRVVRCTLVLLRAGGTNAV